MLSIAMTLRKSCSSITEAEHNMQFFQNIISTCGVSSHDQAKQALFQRNLMISRNISREPEEIRLIRSK